MIALFGDFRLLACTPRLDGPQTLGKDTDQAVWVDRLVGRGPEHIPDSMVIVATWRGDVGASSPPPHATGKSSVGCKGCKRC